MCTCCITNKHASHEDMPRDSQPPYFLNSLHMWEQKEGDTHVQSWLAGYHKCSSALTTERGAKTGVLSAVSQL